jgi:diketogulonate reductase-like aldo/keto reductase
MNRPQQPDTRGTNPTMATATTPILKLNNGVQMPALGLGVYQSHPADTVAAVETALGEGYRLIELWHLEHGLCAIPKSVKPHRIAENFDVFDFTLQPDEVAAIDALDTGVRGGPDPELLNRETAPLVVDNS